MDHQGVMSKYAVWREMIHSSASRNRSDVEQFMFTRIIPASPQNNVYRLDVVAPRVCNRSDLERSRKKIVAMLGQQSGSESDESFTPDTGSDLDSSCIRGAGL